MNMTNLTETLWDHGEEGENYDTTLEQIAAFISNRIDNGEFAEYSKTEDVEVPDSDVTGWVEQFKLWLTE